MIYLRQLKLLLLLTVLKSFCHKPKNHRAKAETFSSYKHHNTVKFLIGVTPSGLLVLYRKHGVVGLLINTWPRIVEL